MDKNEKLISFYQKCAEQGYTDMSDAEQSLKAKVIASDLQLNYSKIGALFDQGRKAYEEKTAREAEAAEKKRAEKERLAVNGELLMHVKTEKKTLDVFRRPDGSLYCEADGKRYDGFSVQALKGATLNYDYHPETLTYTSATVGGVTTGGVSKTEAYFTESVNSTGTGYIEASYRGSKETVKSVKLEQSVCDAFRRDLAFRKLSYQGTITCYSSSGSGDADLYRQTAFGNGLNYEAKMSLLSKAADSTRLPLSVCEDIVRLINRILRHDYPLSDEELYQKAIRLSESADAADLKKAAELFASLEDYKDAAERIQGAKEKMILASEAGSRKKKRNLIIAAAAIVVVLIASAVGIYVSAQSTIRTTCAEMTANLSGRTFNNVNYPQYGYSDMTFRDTENGIVYTFSEMQSTLAFGEDGTLEWTRKYDRALGKHGLPQWTREVTTTETFTVVYEPEGALGGFFIEEDAFHVLFDKGDLYLRVEYKDDEAASAHNPSEVFMCGTGSIHDAPAELMNVETSPIE